MQNKGFIALTSVIIVSSLILVFTFIKSEETALFFNQVELKKTRIENYFNAESCIDRAIINLSHNYFYEISTTTQMIDLHCSIDMVKSENDIRIIKVTGNSKNINIKKQASVRLYDNRLEIISIE